MSLKLDSLTHTYHSEGLEPRTVLHPLPTLQLAAGEQVLLRGISGSGKTTLLNILAGLLRPTAGEVFLNEQPLYALSESQRDRFRNRHIGYVFQNHYLVSMLTAVENVAMPLAFAGVSQRDRHGRAQTLLQQVGLHDYIEHRPAQLSTGQRLRVGVVRALANQPSLVLADEPTAALDGQAAEEVMDLLQATCQAQEAILIVASHDPAVVSRFNTIWNLNAGQLAMSNEQ